MSHVTRRSRKLLTAFLEAKNIRSFPKAAVKHFSELEALPNLEDVGDEHKSDLLTEEEVVSLLKREGIIDNLRDNAGDPDEEDAGDPGMKDD